MATKKVRMHLFLTIRLELVRIYFAFFGTKQTPSPKNGHENSPAAQITTNTNLNNSGEMRDVTHA